MQCKLAVGNPVATDSGEATVSATSRSRSTHSAPEDDLSGLERTPSAPSARNSRKSKRESEQFFRTTFERAIIGIAHTSPDGRWLRFNQRLCDLLGYSRAELATHTFQDVTHPDDLDDSVARLRRLLAGEIDTDEWDKRYVRKDGTMIWVHMTVLLVRTPESKPDYFITMVQDITERKRLEEERTQALERERMARREAEAARTLAEVTNAQLQALQALTDTALSHLALDDLLRELLDRVTAVMAVDNVAIFLLDEDGRTLTMRAACGLLEGEVGQVHIPVGQGIAGRIAASRVPLIVDDTSAFDVYKKHPLLGERLCSVAGMPLLVEDPMHDSAEGHEERALDGRLVGAIHVGSATPRHFTAAEIQLLQRAADRIALALDRARLYAAEQDARQRAEAALARAVVSEAEAADRAARLNTTLETMADGVAVYDEEGRPIQSNRAYRELYALDCAPAGFDCLSVFDRAPLLHLRDALTRAPLPLERAPVARALRGEVVTGSQADLLLQAFDGRELEVNASAVPIQDPDGRIAGAVSVLRDLTERNRLARERETARADELAARELSQRLEAFLATAAHDLRTPLTAVVGFLGLAAIRIERLAALAATPQAECPDCTQFAHQIAAVRAYLEDADQGAERLKRLLERLLDLAAVRVNKLELHPAPCDLVAVVREQIEVVRVTAPSRTIRLHGPEGCLAHGESVPVIPVEADADRIGEVVTNYLTNALKYAPASRPLDVSVEVVAAPAADEGQVRVAREAQVAVRDQGPGLSEREQARVWERFHRAPGITVQRGAPGGMEGGGLGLGLYICKAIVAAHGGQVGVESAVGQGSTFWFTLPLSGPVAGLTGTNAVP